MPSGHDGSPVRSRLHRVLGALIAVLSSVACGAPPPAGLGPTPEGSLRPCPETPNCVHTGQRHPPGTEPIHLRLDIGRTELLDALQEVVESMPRTTLVRRADGYLHAEERSRVFRFVDDVELLVTEERELVVRSASRVGRGDLGVNGRRVGRLRAALAEAGLLRG